MKFKTTIFAGLMFWASCAQADNFLHVLNPSQPPVGFVAYCKTHKADCLPQATNEFTASPKNLSDLYEINRLVNRAIEPVTDEENYGVSEFWTIPNKRGDCEDFALLKQQLLKALDWPQSALLLTVVLDEKGQAHAVLVARTDQGDFVLDNKTNEVRLWTEYPYRFVMRQSSLDPSKWYSIAK